MVNQQKHKQKHSHIAVTRKHRRNRVEFCLQLTQKNESDRTVIWVFLAIWTTIGVLGGLGLVLAHLLSSSSQTEPARTLLNGVLYPVIAMWGLPEWGLGMWLFATFLPQVYIQKIRISPTELQRDTYIQGQQETTRHVVRYQLDQISNVRAYEGDHSCPSQLLLDYQGQTQVFCDALPMSEATHMAQLLAGMAQFSCHTVQTIIFGTPAFSISSHDEQVLQNPDVSELTCPFLQLKRLVLYANSYDPLLVERFMTYAINTMSTKYLKKRVAVEVYGPQAKVSPNMWNMLNHYCARVTVHVDNLVLEEGKKGDVVA